MKNLSRRRFIQTGTAGLVSAGFLAGKSLSAKERAVITRPLGKTGLTLPVVSMGVMNSMDDTLFKRSWEIGVRHFDTAAGYQRGRNEMMVGKALEELGVRDQAVVATKIQVRDAARAMSTSELRDWYIAQTEESLKRLRTDYVDILYTHNVQDRELVRLDGILQAMTQLKKDGKIRFAGFSTHTNMGDCIDEAMKLDVYEVILTTWNYAMQDDTDYRAVLKRAADKGIGLVAMKTQCSQLWYQRNLPEEQQALYRDILHTAVLKWALNNSFIHTAVPGYKTFQEMEEDFSVAYDLEYTDAERRYLEDRQVRLSLGYCVQCRTCEPACPHGVQVPELMRAHLYAAGYASLDKARETLEEIPRSRGLEACGSCGDCRAVCVNTVPISERIRSLRRMFG